MHKGFRVLDTVPHMLTRARIADLGQVHVVRPEDVPNPHWLHPGQPSAGQREFGARLLSEHVFVALPSAVSSFSWNLVFDPSRAKGLYDKGEQVRFALDPRLHPPLAESWVST